MRALRTSLLFSLGLVACTGGGPSDGDPETDAVDETDDTVDPDTLEAPVVALDNPSPRTDDDLVARVTNVDATATYVWRWTLGGTARPDLDDQSTVAASETRKGDVWKLVVVARRGDVTSEPGSVEVVIANTPPSATVQITPDPATAGDDLTAEVTGVDADGDAIAYTYQWTVDGSSFGVTESTISAAFLERDQFWSVAVVPNDGEADGEAATDSTTIQNSPPVISEATLAPLAPTTTDDVVGTVRAEDPDGDGVRTIEYAWFVNGTAIATNTTGNFDNRNFDKGDEVWFVATAIDRGNARSAGTESNRVTVVNTAPEGGQPTVSPNPATTLSTLTCTPSGWFDADSDVEGWRYTWVINGVVTSGQTASTLPARTATKGQAVNCTAAPYDGTVAGLALSSDTLTIANAPPSLTRVTLSPTSPTVSAPIVATAVGAADPDGDAVTLRYAWFRNGTPIVGATGASLVSGYSAGDGVRVTVTPVDSSGLVGTSVSSADILVANRPPSVTEVSLTPTTIRTNDTARATATVVDEDGQPVTVRYRWRVNNVVVREVDDAEGDGDQLPGSFFAKGDQITVTVVPRDSFGEGNPRTAGPRVVSNSVPFVVTATISPSSPVEGSTLTCTASGWSDADGDPAGYRWRWSVNSRLIDTLTNTLSSSDFDKGQTVTCFVIPFDGTEEGPQVPSLPVVVGNTPPTLASVSIAPTSPGVGDTLTATLGSASDVDRNDIVSYRYAWKIDGELRATSPTLAWTAWLPGQSIVLEVTPNDGTSDGATVTSNSVVTRNTGPVVATAAVSPAAPDTLTVITASYEAFDADGEDLDITYRWLVNDVVVAEGASDELDPALSDRGDLVKVTVIGRDPSGASASRTSSSVLIRNTKPRLASATVQPANPVEASVLTCVPSGWSDPDGDPEQVRITWFRGSTQVQVSTTLTGASFAKGDRISCRAEPFDADPTGPGASVTSPSVIVGNTAPTLGGALLSDASPVEASVIEVATVSAADVDGDTLTPSVRWLVNGVEVSTEATLDGDAFAKGDEIQAAVLVSDGEATSAEALSDVGVVGNTPPEVVGASVGPAGASPTTTLVLDLVGNDVDEDAISYTVTWLVDGFPVASGVDRFTLSPGTYFTNSIVRADIVPNDGEADGTLFRSTPLLVGNQAPSITSVVVAPTEAFEASTLTCTPSGWNDPEGASPAYQYRWLVNGVVRSSNPSLDGRFFSKGDSVVCRVLPTDGFSTGNPVDSAPVVIRNSRPTATSAVLTRVNPREADVVGVNILGQTDPDGDTVTRTFRWLVDGVEVATTPTVGGAVFDKGDSIRVEVTLSDGTDSSMLSSNTTTAVNTPPNLASLQLTPTGPRVTDDLVAVPGAVTDPDPGDVPTLVWAWTVGSLPLPLVDGDTLVAGNFVKGDQVAVTVTPTDGESSGNPVQAGPVSILNTPPRVIEVVIDPDDVDRASEPTCVPVAWEDDDGDEVVFAYEWQVNAERRGTNASISTSSYARGDELRCFVRAYDGETFGAQVGSEAATVGNTPPSLVSIRISPEVIRETSVAEATVLGPTDIDGDVVTWTFQWTVNGAPAGTTSRIDGTVFSRGDVLRVTVTPFDGFDPGPPIVSPDLVVRNTAPTVVGPIVVSPEALRTASPVSATVTGTADADGDSASVLWDFLVDGVVVQSGPSSTLNPGPYRRGQTVQVRATAFDGIDYGPPLTTTGSVVQNSVPSAPTVAVAAPTVNPGVESPVCSIVSTSVDTDGDTLRYQFRWVYDITITRAESTATSDTLSASLVGEGEAWFCSARAFDGVGYSPWSASVSVTGKYPNLESCDAHYDDGKTTSGVYRIDPDGQNGGEAPYDVYCDQTRAGGGWVRIVRTTGRGVDFGQRTYALVSSYAAVGASQGVYEAFRRFGEFREVMIVQASGAQAGRFAAFGLEDPTALPMLDYLEGCRDAAPIPGSDPAGDVAFDYPSTSLHTAWYSGTRFDGDLQVYGADGALRVASHFFVCGVNRSSDNDVSYLAVSDHPGRENNWDDLWRGEDQVGTAWSFASADYHNSSATHIGTSWMSGLAGWKGAIGTGAQTWHEGAYELYVR